LALAVEVFQHQHQQQVSLEAFMVQAALVALVVLVLHQDVMVALAHKELLS
jgi:hypothetical protein